MLSGYPRGASQLPLKNICTDLYQFISYSICQSGYQEKANSPSLIQIHQFGALSSFRLILESHIFSFMNRGLYVLLYCNILMGVVFLDNGTRSSKSMHCVLYMLQQHFMVNQYRLKILYNYYKHRKLKTSF